MVSALFVDLENALRQLEDLHSLAQSPLEGSARPNHTDAAPAPPDGHNLELQTSFGSTSTNADSSVSSRDIYSTVQNDRDAVRSPNASSDAFAPRPSDRGENAEKTVEQGPPWERTRQATPTHETTPTYVQTVSLTPDVNAADLAFGPKVNGHPVVQRIEKKEGELFVGKNGCRADGQAGRQAVGLVGEGITWSTF